MAFAIESKSKLAIFDGAAQTLPGVHQIEKIAWYATADAATLTLRVAGDTDVAHHVSTAANQYIKIEHLCGAWVEDLKTQAMTSGKLYVQYE